MSENEYNLAQHVKDAVSNAELVASAVAERCHTTHAQLVTVILQTQAWYEVTREQLQEVVDDDKADIQLGEEEDGVTLRQGSPTNAAFRAGLSMALSVLGDFPLKLDIRDEEDSQ